MHSCYDPILIYGIKEEKENIRIDNTILDDYDIYTYTDSVVRNYACNIYYGICVNINNNGQIIINEEVKDIVDNFAKKFNFTKIGYYLCISGDYYINEFKTYDPNEYYD